MGSLQFLFFIYEIMLRNTYSALALFRGGSRGVDWVASDPPFGEVKIAKFGAKRRIIRQWWVKFLGTLV